MVKSFLADASSFVRSDGLCPTMVRNEVVNWSRNRESEKPHFRHQNPETDPVAVDIDTIASTHIRMHVNIEFEWTASPVTAP